MHAWNSMDEYQRDEIHVKALMSEWQDVLMDLRYLSEHGGLEPRSAHLRDLLRKLGVE